MQEQLRQLKVLFDQLELREHGIKKSVSGGSALNSDFESDAEDFLQAAEDEFELIDYAGALNNANRAISCQIDEVLECLGYHWKRKQLREKLDLIARCGFAAPRILKRVNDARNLLEHEYVHPAPETTEEALDIATLFVNATRRHFQMFMGEFYVGNGAERIDQFHFRRELVFTFNDNTPEFRGIWVCRRVTGGRSDHSFFCRPCFGFCIQLGFPDSHQAYGCWRSRSQSRRGLSRALHNVPRSCLTNDEANRGPSLCPDLRACEHLF